MEKKPSLSAFYLALPHTLSSILNAVSSLLKGSSGKSATLQEEKFSKIITVFILFFACEYFMENMCSCRITNQKLAMLEPPRNPWKFPMKGIQTDAAFLHQVFQMLQYDIDASLSMDKVPVWVLMQESRRWALSVGQTSAEAAWKCLFTTVCEAEE